MRSQEEKPPREGYFVLAVCLALVSFGCAIAWVILALNKHHH